MGSCVSSGALNADNPIQISEYYRKTNQSPTLSSSAILGSREKMNFIKPISNILMSNSRTSLESNSSLELATLCKEYMREDLYNALVSSPMTEYSVRRLSVSKMPEPTSVDSLFACAVRLKKLGNLIDKDRISKRDLLENLYYAISVLETTYIEETKRLHEVDDELSEVAQDSIPDEVRNWLSTTFSKSAQQQPKDENKPTFRSVANVIRAGIVVERIYRRLSSCSNLAIPPNVMLMLKAEIDLWNFNVFEINDASENHALKYVGYELLHKYDLIRKFKLDTTILENFLIQLEIGYSKNKNPYHNLIHAADVAQTSHSIMLQTKIGDWLNDIEVFSVLIAALIHDYDHTGTTNNFHIQTKSNLALLYNDRGVLENHHVSSIFRLTQEEEFNLFENMTNEQYKEFRNSVIDIVLNTDMTLHFTQLKIMKNLLTIPENIDRQKALSLLVHCADISHPAKTWSLHEKWSDVLCEEFFLQGDREKALGLPISPLCDRNTVVVPQSQIGFIDFIVEPSFQVLGDMIEKMLAHILQTNKKDTVVNNSASGNVSTDEDEMKVTFQRPWMEHFRNNKDKWNIEAELWNARKEGAMSAEKE